MELRTLRYFLSVAREENMTHAAARLHITQSALSKQIKGLEAELGKKLFVRRSFSIELTDEGRLLRDRAAELVELADKVEAEFRSLDEEEGGEIYLGMAESYQVRLVARELCELRKSRPKLHFHVTSGDTEQVCERLDRGLLDFALLCEKPDGRKYEWVELPANDVWGAVLPTHHPLASKTEVTVDDLIGEQIFASRQGWEGELAEWAGSRWGDLTLSGSFRLSYNASLFVQENLGILLTFDKLIDTSAESGLVFRPLSPRLEARLYMVWGRRQLLTPVAREFVGRLRDTFGDMPDSAK